MTINNSKYSIWLPIIIAISIVVGMMLGKNFFYSPKNSYVLYFGNDKLNNLLDKISEEYVDTINKQEIIERAIPIILQQLDPHSVYIPASDFNAVNEPLEGNFDGIGVQFNIQNDTIVVIKTIPNGPSEKVGVKDGDRIVKINDSLVANKKITTSFVMKKLRGKRGTEVKISVWRASYPNLIDFTIVRDKIPIHSIDIAYMLSKTTGYIKINEFSKTTYDEFIQAIETLTKQGMKQLILDLRQNGGGVMESAVRIADEFLEEGNLIVYTQGKSRKKHSIYATSKGNCEKLPLVILIDELSASASEILAGAIQDNDRGIIVGRRSFGKALVQEQVEFNDQSAVRLTIARYYTPTGRCIQKPYDKGIDKYENELLRRFTDGELQYQDSIKFPDSLKYKTPKGKIVYGGGGIMPDVFVPIDTTGINNFSSAVSNTGLIYRFAFNYVDKNRILLKTKKTVEELKKYLDTQPIYDEFIAYTTKQGIKATPHDINNAKQILDIQLKANIARNIFDYTGYYPIIHKADKTLSKALELFK